MKGININGKIILHRQAPKTWNNILGVNYMTDEELKTIGFYDVVEPSKSRSQKYGIIYFDSDNEVYTYPLESITFTQTLAELKYEKIQELKKIFNAELAKTDWIIIRDQELGNTTDQDILDDRAQLRTDFATHETSINSKSTKASVVEYQLPSFI